MATACPGPCGAHPSQSGIIPGALAAQMGEGQTQPTCGSPSPCRPCREQTAGRSRRTQPQRPPAHGPVCEPQPGRPGQPSAHGKGPSAPPPTPGASAEQGVPRRDPPHRDTRPTGTPAPQGQHWRRIQFSSPCRFLGGPGMFSRTSWASCDLSRTTPLSRTAVCILLTLDWFLGRETVTQLLQPRPGLWAQALLAPIRKGGWAHV